MFRLIGMPLVRRVGGVTAAAGARRRPAHGWSATCPRPPGASTSSRSRLRDGIAEPIFGASALLSVLTAADGYVVVPDDATGLPAGTEVDVTLYT